MDTPGANALKYGRVERERRFLLRAVPEGKFIRSRRITDRYLRGTRLRLREIVDPATTGTVYKLTQKIPATAATPPLVTTIYLTRAEYDALAALPADLLTKTRHSLPPFGIDVFDPPHAGLVLAEAEFDDDAAMRALSVPSGWIEVTDDARYAGATLASGQI
ncbi:MAG TPA: hypothetical protein VGK48_14440 [Terriglobia bacterium]|jgi:CYTH domain-containing protein